MGIIDIITIAIFVAVMIWYLINQVIPFLYGQ